MAKDWLKESGAAFLPKAVQQRLDKYLVGDDHSTFYINGWSLWHMAAGVVFGLIFSGASYKVALAVHTLWELYTLGIGVTAPTARGFLDIVVDTVFFMVGFAMTKGARSR